jgi:hypothetical protein
MKKKSTKIIVKKIEMYEVEDQLNPATLPIGDMLRYDHCYHCDDYPGVVAYINNKKPTIARWSSFLQKITPIGQARFIDPANWYTYTISPGGLAKEMMNEETDFLGNPIQWEFKCTAGVEKVIELMMKMNRNLKNFVKETLES